ncbi:hyphal wall protein 1-like [Diachasma alloeum]|uniref:hyphal wall protein 1-like n=1 Tax=Diachasma alloeum TaxID=454923 RepID=UPI000738456A|nr:hyphal wall protein 1-like [Diachasma alloeum]
MSGIFNISDLMKTYAGIAAGRNSPSTRGQSVGIQQLAGDGDFQKVEPRNRHGRATGSLVDARPRPLNGGKRGATSQRKIPKSAKILADPPKKPKPVRQSKRDGVLSRIPGVQESQSTANAGVLGASNINATPGTMPPAAVHKYTDLHTSIPVTLAGFGSPATSQKILIPRTLTIRATATEVSSTHDSSGSLGNQISATLTTATTETPFASNFHGMLASNFNSTLLHNTVPQSLPVVTTASVGISGIQNGSGIPGTGISTLTSQNSRPQTSLPVISTSGVLTPPMYTRGIAGFGSSAASQYIPIPLTSTVMTTAAAGTLEGLNSSGIPDSRISAARSQNVVTQTSPSSSTATVGTPVTSDLSGIAGLGSSAASQHIPIAQTSNVIAATTAEILRALNSSGMPNSKISATTPQIRVTQS